MSARSGILVARALITLLVVSLAVAAIPPSSMAKSALVLVDCDVEPEACARAASADAVNAATGAPTGSPVPARATGVVSKSIFLEASAADVLLLRSEASLEDALPASAFETSRTSVSNPSLAERLFSDLTGDAVEEGPPRTSTRVPGSADARTQFLVRGVDSAYASSNASDAAPRGEDARAREWSVEAYRMNVSADVAIEASRDGGSANDSLLGAEPRYAQAPAATLAYDSAREASTDDRNDAAPPDEDDEAVETMTLVPADEPSRYVLVTLYRWVEPAVPSDLRGHALKVALVASLGLTFQYHRVLHGAERHAGLRGRILEALRDRGPTRERDLADALGVDRTTVRYHARLLVKANAISCRHLGRASLYQLPGDGRGRAVVEAGVHPVAYRILEAAREVPGCNRRELAAFVGTSPQNAHHHLRKLLAAGNLVIRVDGRGARYFPA